MNIIGKIIDKFSNYLIKVGVNDEWMRGIVYLRYKILKNLYQEKNINHNFIVSLTSYPPRYPTLEYTIKCLLSQTIRPRQVVLWLYEEDEKILPLSIKLLQSETFKIKTTKENYKSYTKIYPAIIEYPESYILTADDDIFYNATWASQILKHSIPDDKRILCHRAHRIAFDDDDNIKPYSQWKWCIGGEVIHSGVDIFFTGVGGVLYPPAAIPAEDINPKFFLTLCERADDIWLYFMTIKNKYTPTKIPSDQLEYTWRSSQEVALKHDNVDSRRNDEYIRKLVKIYGKPWESN